MKCSECGYYNLPGVAVCGQCGRTHGAASRPAPSASPENLYPPRARDRSWRKDTAYRAAVPAGRLREFGMAFARRAGIPDAVGSNSELRGWLLSCASLVPGLGQLLQGRLRSGALILLGTAAALAAALITYRLPISNTLFLAVLLLLCGSVWDSARTGFPDQSTTAEMRQIRALRLALLAAGVVASFVTVFLVLGSIWFSMYEVNSDRAAPVFQEGDAFIVQGLSHASTELHRGDLILADRQWANPTIERVIGLPGDTVVFDGQTLSVNGKPLPPDRLPLILWAPSTPTSLTLERGQIAIWQQRRDGREQGGFSSLLAVDDRDVDGRIIAVYNPPQRRRWIGSSEKSGPPQVRSSAQNPEDGRE